MSRRSIESQNPNPLPDAVNPLIDTFFQPELLSLLFGSVLLIAFGKAFARPKGILANAYFGGRIEKMNALRIAQKQREKCKKTLWLFLLAMPP
ncbi:MAG: hypothetical protein HC820_04035 [Hydrococcus sp. RM1_1_31]|nr:hypothetical protein [Hydrococcus sp. RM1_1_31]